MSAPVSGIALRLKREQFASTRVLTMRKISKKKAAAMKAVKSVTQKPKPALTFKGRGKKGLVSKQPQVKQQAAVAHGKFLYTDDAWSLR